MTADQQLEYLKKGAEEIIKEEELLERLKEGVGLVASLSPEDKGPAVVDSDDLLSDDHHVVGGRPDDVPVGEEGVDHIPVEGVFENLDVDLLYPA